MKDIGELKDFFRYNLGGRINEDNFSIVVFTSRYRYPDLQFGCWSTRLHIPDNLINELCSLYISVGIKYLSRESGVYGAATATVYFSSCPEIDLNYSFGQILIWSIRDDLDE